MHAEGVAAPVIAKTIHLTEQSLEKILASLDKRPEKTLALEGSPEVNAMRIENAELLARLAKYEDLDSGAPTKDEDETPAEDEVPSESEAEVESEATDKE